MFAHFSERKVDLPDAGEGMCCMGAAAMGPDRCTCWVPEFDVKQWPAIPVSKATPRATMCDDCAFRADSPERSGDARFQHSDEGEIEEMVDGRDTFFCHKGMRRQLALVHPSGVRVESGPGAYRPLIVGDVAYRADGTPADICAGLCAARRKRA